MSKPVEEITVADLKQLYADEADFFLLDVRQPEEYEEANMGGELIPLGELTERVNELPKDKLIVVHCRSGARSAKAVEYLQEHGFAHVKNLQGGILAWQQEK